MRLGTLERRVDAMEKREAARPTMPTIALNLAGRDCQRLYVNGTAIDRNPKETSGEFLLRARATCPPSKRFVSIVTSNPPQRGE